MEQVISLYKEEISAYQQQIEDLKQRNHDSDQRNATLIDKIRNLEDLIEKANVANRDLNLAFEHVHQENARLQANANNQEALVPSIGNTKHIAEVDSRKDDLAAESLVWMSEREQFKQRNKFLERECQRYARDNMHLGKQVRHLLRTLEEERGMIIRQQSQVTQDNQMICAADVIDRHLITFESIEELQQQNQKLLSLVKDLSEEQEAREVVAESEEVKRLTTDLQKLKEQLDTIKSDREKILTALKTIHKERDLFKILLCKTRQVEHLTPEIFQRMVSVACASGPAITGGPDSSLVESEAHVEDLKRMVTKLEHNLEDMKKELSDSKAASAAEIALKNQLLETAHLKILEVTKNLESSKECNDLLNENIKALTAEFDDVRTKCQKMTLDLEMSNQKFEEAEGKIKDLERELNTERKNTQQAIIEASRLAEQNQQMLQSFESEKHSRKEELASLFEQFQKKHESRLEKEIELQRQIDRLHYNLREMQHQRNLERERRVMLDRLYHRQPLPGQKTRTNRPIRLKKPKPLDRTQDSTSEQPRLNNVSHTQNRVMKDKSPPKKVNHIVELNNMELNNMEVNNMEVNNMEVNNIVNNFDEMKNIEDLENTDRLGDIEEVNDQEGMGNIGELDSMEEIGEMQELSDMDELRNMEVLKTMEDLKNVDELTYTEEQRPDGEEERSLEEPGPNSTEQKFIKLKRRKFD